VPYFVKRLAYHHGRFSVVSPRLANRQARLPQHARRAPVGEPVAGWLHTATGLKAVAALRGLTTSVSNGRVDSD